MTNNLNKSQIFVITLNYGYDYEEAWRTPLVALFSEKLAIEIKDELTSVIDALIPKRDAIFEKLSTILDETPDENFDDLLERDNDLKEQQVRQLVATYLPKSKYLAEYEKVFVRPLLEGHNMFISMESVNFKGE